MMLHWCHWLCRCRVCVLGKHNPNSHDSACLWWCYIQVCKDSLKILIWHSFENQWLLSILSQNTDERKKNSCCLFLFELSVRYLIHWLYCRVCDAATAATDATAATNATHATYATDATDCAHDPACVCYPLPHGYQYDDHMMPLPPVCVWRWWCWLRRQL